MPADLTPFRQTIIRISNEADELYGVGCLLNPHQAITCAHVVADALGYERHIDFIPPGKVRINRPFAEESIHSVTAQVKAWYPRGEHKLSDMALLQLDEPLTELVSLKLSYSMNLTGVRFKAWGGPAGHEIHLIDIEGIIGSPIGNGRYRLDVRDSNYKIEKGCSGAPIVDITTGQVLGLIAQEELDQDIQAGFLIPATHWRQTGWFPEQNAGEALEPLKTWIKRRYQLRPRERQRIEAFVAYYAGTQLEPMPFAGRSAWLQHLDQWLAQDHSRLLLLSGTAGRGKSALLLHWLAQLIHHPPLNLTILFFPISLRFETSNELEGLRLLHAALCDVFENLRFSPQEKPDINDYRDRLFSAWEHITNHSDQRYLLAIDGIDESANHWLLKEVLPMDLPANLHLLLSARDCPGQADGTSWLRALNQQSGKLLALTPLDPSAIAEAIIQLGRPLDELAEQQAFVEQLYRLTDQGDPLLLTLWIGQIWQHREAPPQVEQLQRLKPSFAGFYKTWLVEQQKIWEEQSIAIHPSDFNRLMQVLASAYGPLLLEHELIEVLKHIPSPVSWTYPQLREVLTTASRLVVGDGEHQGFSLVHPRLNDYFQEELAKQPRHQREVHEAYLHWGSEVVARLNQNKLMPDSCPRYLLHHYTEHVAAAPTTMAHLKPRDVLEKYWLPLLEGGWHQAWEAYEGAWNGFLSDLQRVVQALRQYHQACYKRGERTAMKLAVEVRCALIRASFHTLNQNFPVKLVIQLVEAGLWSLSRAERVAIQFEARKEVDCLVGLVGLAKIVLPKDKARLLQQALIVVENVQDERNRAEALIMLAPLLVGEPRQQILQQALTTAENIQYERDRAEALTRLVPLLEEEARQQVLQQALTDAENIRDEDEWDRVKALTQLVHLLEDEPRQQVLQQVLTAAENMQYKKNCAKALIQLAPLLEEEACKQVLQQALTAAENLQDEGDRAEVLTTLAPLLEKEPRQQVLQQALTAAENIQYKMNCAKAFIQLVPLLEEEAHQQVLQQALITVGNIQDEGSRVEALTQLAPLLEDELRQQALQQALTVTGNIQVKWVRAKALTQLAPLLEGEPRQQILQQALTTMVGRTQNEWDRARTLIELVSSLLIGEQDQQFLQQALTIAEEIQDKRCRAKTLIELAPLLVGELRQQVLQQALNDAGEIQDQWDRAGTLIELAPFLVGEPRQQVLQQALNDAEEIQDQWNRANTLIKLAPLLVGEPRQQVLQRALQVLQGALNDVEDFIKYDWDLVGTWKKLVLLLIGEKNQQVLQQALTTAGNILYERQNHPEVLTVLAPFLTEKTNLQKDFLKMALALSDGKKRIATSATLIQNNPDLLTYALWADWLDHAPLERSELFEVTGELCTAAIQLTGNPQEANEIARAVMDVVRWWP